MPKSYTFRWSLVGLLTVIVSLVSSTFLFAFGLILLEFLLYPMALGIVALFTALTASWSSNWLIADEQHTPPRSVVIACEILAVALVVLLIILRAADALNVPPIFVSTPAALLLAATALVSSKSNRSSQPATAHERRQTLIWIALSILAVPLIIFIASLFGWAGA
jgi:hypothetical protein